MRRVFCVLHVWFMWNYLASDTVYQAKSSLVTVTKTAKKVGGGYELSIVYDYVSLHL